MDHSLPQVYGQVHILKGSVDGATRVFIVRVSVLRHIVMGLCYNTHVRKNLKGVYTRTNTNTDTHWYTHTNMRKKEAKKKSKKK